jgi:hypothetical protein
MKSINPPPLKAIRLKCLDCSAGSSNEVHLCAEIDCPLYRYRKGCYPKKDGRAIGSRPPSPKQLEARKRFAAGFRIV